MHRLSYIAADKISREIIIKNYQSKEQYLDFYVPWLGDIFFQQYCAYAKGSCSLTLSSQESINKFIWAMYNPHTLKYIS